MKIIFLLGLPRSGTTLLQKCISTSNSVFSKGESWLLLPLFNLDKRDFIISGYSHSDASLGIKEHIQELDFDYNILLKKFVYEFYSNIAIDEKYFLDKTPRYHIILDDLYGNYSDSLFILLYRNPLAICSSIINTWGKGRLNRLYFCWTDIIDGPKNLIKESENSKFILCYEDLIRNPEKELKKISLFLNIDDIDISKLKSSSSILGDKGRFSSYDYIQKREYDDGWKKSINSKFRKILALKYLRIIPDLYLEKCNLNKDFLENEINSIRTYKIGVLDILDFVYSFFMVKSNIHSVFRIVKFGKTNKYWS